MSLDPADLMTADDVARQCNVSRQLVNYWHTKGHLKPVVKVGRSSYFLRTDVQRVERDMRLSPRSRRVPRAIDGTV